jgi:hypothetical protein
MHRGMVKYAFKLDISDREMLKGEFECFARIARLQPFYHLSVPRDLSHLPVVQDTILKDLESDRN